MASISEMNEKSMCTFIFVLLWHLARMKFRTKADVMFASYEPLDAVLEPRAMLSYVPMFPAPLPQMRFEWLRSKIICVAPLLCEVVSRDVHQFLFDTSDRGTKFPQVVT